MPDLPQEGRTHNEVLHHLQILVVKEAMRGVGQIMPFEAHGSPAAILGSQPGENRICRGAQTFHVFFQCSAILDP